LLLNKNKDIYNDFLELALNKLNGSTGADISENSFNRNVFKALLFSEEQKINTMDSLIKKLDLLSMEGQDLDNFYEQLFRIPRLNSSSFGIMYISLLLNYGSVLIPKGTVLKMNNIFVETVTEYSVSQGEIVLEVKRLAVLPDNLVFVGLDNNVFLDIQNVTPDNADLVNEEKMDFIKTNFVVLETGTYQTESDAEYKIRAHNILQNYGYNNILKMQKQAMAHPRLANILFEETKYSTKAIIIPTSFEFIDEVYEATMEIVNYFKGGEVHLLKPSLTSFTILGIREQLINWYIGSNINLIDKYIVDIEALMKNYVTQIYLTKADKTFYMDEIEFIINKYFASNNVMFSLDEDKLEVIYKTYGAGNYYTNVTEGTIKRRGSKKVNTNICFFEKLV
jgi:hypothetical protein